MQIPSEPGRLQEVQRPEQAVAQQAPSAQVPLAQSESQAQASPRAPVRGPVALHTGSLEPSPPSPSSRMSSASRPPSAPEPFPPAPPSLPAAPSCAGAPEREQSAASARMRQNPNTETPPPAFGGGLRRESPPEAPGLTRTLNRPPLVPAEYIAAHFPTYSHSGQRIKSLLGARIFAGRHGPSCLRRLRRAKFPRTVLTE